MAELAAIDELFGQYSVGALPVRRRFEGLGVDDAEDLELELAAGFPAGGVVRIPNTGVAHTVVHWCQFLSQARVLLAGSEWTVDIEGVDIPWDASSSRFAPPGIDRAKAQEREPAPNKPLAVRDKKVIAREISADLADEGFAFDAKENRVSRTLDEITLSLWFRPLAGNGEVSFDIYSEGMRTWANEQDRWPQTNAARLGLICSYPVTVLDPLRAERGPRPWSLQLLTGLRDTFKVEVTELIRSQGYGLQAMYVSSPEDVIAAHAPGQRLAAFPPPLEYFLFRDRPDFAERVLNQRLEGLADDAYSSFKAAVQDPDSVENCPDAALIAHLASLRLTPRTKQ